jgi:hypothetical protein
MKDEKIIGRGAPQFRLKMPHLSCTCKASFPSHAPGKVHSLLWRPVVEVRARIKRPWVSVPVILNHFISPHVHDHQYSSTGLSKAEWYVGYHRIIADDQGYPNTTRDLLFLALSCRNDHTVRCPCNSDLSTMAVHSCPEKEINIMSAVVRPWYIQWNPGQRAPQLRDHPATKTKFPQSWMVCSLIPLTGPHWHDHPGTQTTTASLEGPKLQIHLCNVTKGPN